jgi:hypothetical protein
MSGTFWGLMLASFCAPRSALDLGKERGHDSAGEGCVVVRDGSVRSAVCYQGAAGRFWVDDRAEWRDCGAEKSGFSQPQLWSLVASSV